MKKIVDRYIRDEVLSKHPLNPNQFAYQPGISTVNAIQNLVNKVSKSVHSKEYALSTFIDVAGAFDNTSYSSISHALSKYRVDEATTN